jgi:hypothetical protein
MVSLIIIGSLIACVTVAVGTTRDRAAVITTLSEMTRIKKTIRERFYPDLGKIPEDASTPCHASRYLCLKNDGPGNPEYQEMLDFVGGEYLMAWDKHINRGFRGPYMEPDTRFQDVSDGQWYPVLADAWGNPYQILMTSTQDRTSARILSTGVNGSDNGGSVFPLPDDIGDDIVMFIFGGGETRSPLED